MSPEAPVLMQRIKTEGCQRSLESKALGAKQLLAMITNQKYSKSC